MHALNIEHETLRAYDNPYHQQMELGCLCFGRHNHMILDDMLCSRYSADYLNSDIHVLYIYMCFFGLLHGFTNLMICYFDLQYEYSVKRSDYQ